MGDSRNGGFYEHELDSMWRYAPRLARSTKIFTEQLSRAKTDFADVVVIFDRNYGHDCRIPVEVILTASRIGDKGDVTIFFITSYCMPGGIEDTYNVWRMSSYGISYVTTVRKVFYEFKRCGGRMQKISSTRKSEGYRSIDWRVLQKLVLDL